MAMLPFLHNAWLTTIELAPWLLVGAVAAGVLHVLLPANFVQRQLTGRWSVLKSVLLGVPLPLCSCGVIPVAVGLRQQQASRGATVGFLIATPQTGVDSMLVSAAMLGWPFAIFKVFAALVTGVIGGWITDTVEDDTINIAPLTEPHAAVNGSRRSLRALIEHAVEILRSIWGWLAIGIFISAAISTFLPNSALEGLAAYGGIAAMAAALAVSLPLYVCATASVPIAASLVAGGLPLGAALVFLMAGPATNMATIGAVHRTLGTRSLIVYLTTIIVGSILAGLFFDSVIATGDIASHLHEHSPAWWGVASALILVALVVWFAWGDASRWLRSQQTIAAADDETEVTLAVEGMTCDNCARHVEQALVNDDRIRTARVTFDPSKATVVGEITASEAIEVIREAGYSAK